MTSGLLQNFGSAWGCGPLRRRVQFKFNINFDCGDPAIVIRLSSSTIALLSNQRAHSAVSCLAAALKELQILVNKMQFMQSRKLTAPGHSRREKVLNVSGFRHRVQQCTFAHDSFIRFTRNCLCFWLLHRRTQRDSCRVQHGSELREPYRGREAQRGLIDLYTVASLTRLIVPKGERVLDLGSGGGIDVFLAASKVGPAGQVIGLDGSAVRRSAIPDLLLLTGMHTART